MAQSNSIRLLDHRSETLGGYGSEQHHPLVRSPKLNTLMLQRGRIVDLFHEVEVHQVSICCHLSLDI